MYRGIFRYLFLLSFFGTGKFCGYSQTSIKRDSIEVFLRKMPDDTNKVNLLITNAKGSLNEYQPNDALKYCAKALKLSQELKFKKGEAISLNLTGTAKCHLLKFQEGLQFHLRSLRLMEEINYLKGQGDVYFFIGDIFKGLSGYEKAIFNFNKAVEKYAEAKDTVAMCSAIEKIGHVTLDSKSKASKEKAIELSYKALAVYRRSLSILKKTKRLDRLAIVYVDIANDYLGLGQIEGKEGKTFLDSSIFYSKLSNEICFNINKQSSAIVNYLNIGEANEYLGDFSGDYSEAVRNYNIAMNITGPDDMSYWKMVAHQQLATIFYKKNDYETSMEHLLISNKLSTKIHSVVSIYENYILMSKIDSIKGNFKEAFHLQKRLGVIKDSLNFEESKRAANLLQAQFDFESKDKEINLLNKNQELQVAQISSQKAIRNYLIEGVVLVALLLLLTFNRFILKKKQNRIIEEKNVELEKLSIVARETANGVFIMNAIGELVWFNEGFTKLFGWATIDEYKKERGKNIYEVSGSNDIIQIIEQCIDERISISYESMNPTKDGRELWVKATITPIFSDDGQLKNLVIVDTDVTELKKAKEIAEQSLKIQEQFLANTSHEIRTPMNGVIGMTRQLLETPLNKEQVEYLNAIKESSNNLLHVVNDILDVSKINSGKIVFEKTEFKLDNIFKNLKFTLQYKVDEKSIYLETYIDNQLPKVLIGDPVRLHQIILNLAGNAIKFTEKGGVTVSANLIKKIDATYHIQFSVKDTGIGIPDDKQSYVFESFAQAETHTTRKYGGTGLGLTISKALVEQQGGEIHLKSKVDVGTEFYFAIGFTEGNPDWQGSIAKQAEGIPENVDLSQINILLVDDNKINQKVAMFELKKWKTNTDIADNANMAFEKLRQKEYHVILMDISMPDIDGLQATKIIRSEFPDEIRNIPIIAMTASALAGEKENCYAAGMNDYVSKPFNPISLYKKITKWGIRRGIEESEENENEQKIKSVRVTNLSILREYAVGDIEYIKDLINIYLESIPEYVRDLNLFYHEKNWEKFGKQAHKMKAPLAYFGLSELKQVLENIELDARKETNPERHLYHLNKVNEIIESSLVELKIELRSLSTELY